jgi:beta-glucosidase/6-phospho-beta-glucosidase/beta-galactosidase
VPGLPTRSRLAQLTQPGGFCWATGIEDTFISEAWPATGRTLDEYELTRHYEYWAEDVDLVAGLGVRAARYGIPWHRVNPAPGRFEWSFADAALGRLLERGVAPIVDLVHYGTPGWLERAFLNPDFPARMAEYASAVAERFRGQVYWYTPLNEPRIAAWYTGRIGWWPPYQRSWRGFAAVLVAICRGIAAAQEALRAIDPEIVLLHVDATDLYEAGEDSLVREAGHRQALVFLALDLLTGRVDAGHALHDWLVARGADPEVLSGFAQRPLELDVVGINLYPMFTRKRLLRVGNRLRVRMVYAGSSLVETLGRLYFARYQRPVFVSETASLGSVARRRRWLDDSVQGVAALRASSIPLVGYTWWPLFSLVAWSYRQGQRDVERHLLRMGLYELDASAGLARVPTALVDRYRVLAASGDDEVGPLGARPHGSA